MKTTNQIKERLTLKKFQISKIKNPQFVIGGNGFNGGGDSGNNNSQTKTNTNQQGA